MIGLRLNCEQYDYDIRTLIQAFCDNEKIVVDGTEDDFTFVADLIEDGTNHYLAIEKDDKVLFSRTLDGASADKMLFRNPLKREVYQLLCEYTGKMLPWGTLTGIRPAKICYQMLDEGKSSKEIIDEFQSTYLSTRQKAELSVTVAQKERELLKNLEYENQYSIYIGIPFCPSRCLYCSFTSFPLSRYESQVQAYIEALEKEIHFVAQTMKEKHLVSIYMGGGTPTSISALQLKRILDAVEDSFDLSHLQEFTVEAGRADSITTDKLRVIKDSAADRISINPQTMHDETLKLIGREHNVQQVVDAYKQARDLGFDNINMDLIVGLPGEDISYVKETVGRIEELRPDNLTVHSLAIKRAARLNLQMDKYRAYLNGSTNEMLEFVDERARIMGLEPYYMYRQKNIPGNLENIGFARPGKEGIYNILIMEEKQTIVALGAGGASKYVYGGQSRIERSENVKDVTTYINRIDEMIERKRVMLHKWQQGVDSDVR